MSNLMLRITMVAVLATGPRVVLCQELADRQASEQQAERFLELLRRRPSFGTALERVAAIHAELGSLDDLIITLKSSAGSDPVEQLIAAMLEIQRGNGAQVVELLESVADKRPDDAVASQSLGLAARAAGDTSKAAAAFERAIALKPVESDLRTIYQDLARLLQQSGHPERSLAVWQRLEEAFPDDIAVREDVARLLQEDGQLKSALDRWQVLAGGTTNPERGAQYRLSVAEIHARLGDQKQALQVLEEVFRQIRPGSWLYELIQTRIEAVILSSGGRQAVVQYYRDRLAVDPRDVSSISRLAELLVDQGEYDAGSALYQQAIQLIPTSIGPRVALVNLLASQGRIREAVLAGQQMIKLADAGSDEYELIGRLVLRDSELEPKEREQRASGVWMRICGDQQDPVRLGYVARLHRRSGLPERAVDLFRQTVLLDPANAQWRQELGETLFDLGRRDEAVSAWGEIAAGERLTTRNLVMLSDILERAGEFDLSLSSMREACQQEPGIVDRLRLAELLQRVGEYDECYQQLELAAELAQSPADRRVVNEARVKVWQYDPGLQVQIGRLREQLEQNDAIQDGWLQLALMHQSIRRTPEAVRYVQEATSNSPDSVLAWQAAAEIYAQAGLLDSAAKANRQLGDLSTSLRQSALQRFIRLEQQLGRTASALEAAQQLAGESPDNPEICRQYMSLCSAAGRDIEGLECLKRCLRLNPDDVGLCVELSELLVKQFQMSEAATWLWRTLNAVEETKQRATVIESLVNVAQQTETFDRLIQRLHLAAGLHPIERSLYVAMAQQQVGDLAKARETLDRASRQFGRDLQILKLQVDLAEASGDVAMAATYQKQVTEISADADDKVRLANLQHKNGELSDTELTWIRDARSGTDVIAGIRSIDRFLDGGRVEAAELMSQRLATDRPRDWRVLYRLALIQLKLGRQSEAAATLQKIVDLDLPPNHVFVERSAPAETRQVQVRRGNVEAVSAQPHVTSRPTSPVARRVTQVLSALVWLKLHTDTEMWSQQLQAPDDYEAARCAAFGLLWLGQDNDGREAIIEALVREQDPDPQRLAGWCTLAIAARWDASQQDLHLDDLVAVLRETERVDDQLMIIALRSPSGVFPRRGFNKSAVVGSRSDQLEVLQAAERVSQDEPLWLSDVGGWSALHREFRTVQTVSAWNELISRLCSSSNPDTMSCATDLALVTQDTGAIRQCFNRLFDLISTPGVKPLLAARQQQLIAWAQLEMDQLDWTSAKQALDLLLELQASHYERLQKSDVDSPTYRLTLDLQAPARPAAASPRLLSDQQSAPEPVRVVPAQLLSQSQSSLLKRFASARSHFDQHFLSLLVRWTYSAQSQQHAQDVLTHLRTIVQNRTLSAERQYPVWIPAALALSALDVQAERPDRAMLSLVPVVQRLPDDVGLRLLLIEHLQSVGGHREALQLLNQIPIQRSRKQILQTERLALQLCAEVQDRDRARLAASRLFELRLERHDVVAAAKTLSALGLPEVAERFTDRLATVTGDRGESLGRLMRDYVDSGDSSAAARIARQVVLKPTITLDDMSVEAAVSLRDEALQVLVATRTVQALITQLQLDSQDDEGSFHRRHLLLELLRLDGQVDAANRVAEPLRESLMKDPDTGIELARQFERQGRLQTACDVCWFLLESDTKLFHRDYYRFIRLFERNGRLSELADLVLNTDLRKDSSGHWAVQQLSERVLRRDRERGLKLFVAAWQAWPASRSALLANVSHEAVWSLPEVSAYRREQVLPAEGRTVSAWSGIAERLQVLGHGQVKATLSHMLSSPLATSHAEDLSTSIKAGIAAQSSWHAGRVYLALLQAVQGNADSSATQMEELLDEHMDNMPATVVWVTACEMERTDVATLQPLVVRMLEHLHQRTKSGTVLTKSNAPWHASPDYLLLQLHARDRDSTSAKAVIKRLIRRLDANPPEADSSRKENRMQGRLELALSIAAYLPEEAERIRREVLTRRPVQGASAKTDRTKQTELLIQAVRERLLETAL